MIALINVSRQEKNWSSQRFLRKFSGKNWARRGVDRLLENINSTIVKNVQKSVDVFLWYDVSVVCLAVVVCYEMYCGQTVSRRVSAMVPLDKAMATFCRHQ